MYKPVVFVCHLCDSPPPQVRVSLIRYQLGIATGIATFFSVLWRCMSTVLGCGRAAASGSCCSLGTTWRSSGSVDTAHRHHPDALRQFRWRQWATE